MTDAERYAASEQATFALGRSPEDQAEIIRILKDAPRVVSRTYTGRSEDPSRYNWKTGKRASAYCTLHFADGSRAVYTPGHPVKVAS